MRFWQGMLLGLVVGGVTGVVVYNRSNGKTKAMMEKRARQASDIIGSAAKAIRMGPMSNNR
jgi:gas vesicle protein